MSYKSCLCSANSSLCVALICFCCIYIVKQTNIKFYSIEIIKTATFVFYRSIVFVTIFLNTQEPRLRPIEALIIICSFNHRFGNKTRNIVKRALTKTWFADISIFDGCHTTFCGIGIEIMRTWINRPLRIADARIEFYTPISICSLDSYGTEAQEH